MDATFQIDLDILQDPLVPSTEKEWMPDVILCMPEPLPTKNRMLIVTQPRSFPIDSTRNLAFSQSLASMAFCSTIERTS